MISVIIPCLNEALNLPRLLAALKAGGDTLELIVVDGGSSDASVALAQRLADRVIVGQATGRAAQMNAGAAEARGEMLWFVHADTQFAAPLEQYLAAIKCAPAWGFCGVRLSGQQWYFRLIAQMMRLRSRWQGIATGDQGIFVRRELFQQCGGYEAIALMEDIALCRKLKKQARPTPIAHCLITSSRQWEQHGVLKTVLLMWYLRLLYFMGVSPRYLARRYYR